MERGRYCVLSLAVRKRSQHLAVAMAMSLLTTIPSSPSPLLPPPPPPSSASAAPAAAHWPRFYLHRRSNGSLRRGTMSSFSSCSVALTSRKSFQSNCDISHTDRATLWSSEGLQKISSKGVVTLASADTLSEQEAAPEDGISNLKLESDILKKRKKREELRRKRLVRKRHLRKKGRWPPSKMAKNKNV